MAEVETRSPKRLSWKRIFLGVLLLGFLWLTFQCYSTYVQLAAPNYIELELPAEGLQTDWTSENHIVYDDVMNYRYFIWQKVGVFDTASSEDAANELDEWLTANGWQKNDYAYGYGFGQKKFEPCQQSEIAVTDFQCRSYYSTTETPLFLCSSYLANVYVEYNPNLREGRVVISTVRISDLSLLLCGLNYL